ncbi:DUF6390 family protein [Rhodococcoides kyotonense]|uniref:Uncharacterized protein n=1 Tax=Rhodococcoides kyotonense TaxID=398843 RepID=A0A239JFC6_9NOCA|nr:DUF6390 family protein [Rhodococcus kyotonensis]SNT04621.1 hypothetical protein SAMN05421642_108203 [Rhodococcus kyotonensis]
MSRGPALFGRYAFPPNELGYCGPPGAGALLEAITNGDGVGRRAREFDGAWTYLDVLARSGGYTDRLDPAVVKAYWVGSDLVDEIDPADLRRRLRVAFAGQPGGILHELRPQDCLAHHSFHVLAVYPWLRMLPRGGAIALSMLQQCRIRWGRVVDRDGDDATVLSRPLLFDGTQLHLGDAVPEQVRWQSAGRALVPDPAEGDLVSLHWSWMCDRLSYDDIGQLERLTDRSLAVANRALRSAHPSPGGTGAPARRSSSD